MLTIGPGDKGSLWSEQERACALKAWQLSVEKPQLTGGDKEEPVSATKLPFQDRAETTHGLKSTESLPVHRRRGTEHKSHSPEVQGDLNPAKSGWNQSIPSRQWEVVATLRQELSPATRDVEIPEPTKAFLIR